jgi:hypothetical protein
MGLKTAEVLSGRLRPTMEIRPDIDAFEEELAILGKEKP